MDIHNIVHNNIHIYFLLSEKFIISFFLNKEKQTN